MGRSKLEEDLSFAIFAAGLPKPEREYRFDAVRRFRFDFAWPAHAVAAEVDGATWTGGRHVRGSGVERDSEKYSLAAVQGWKVIRVTGRMVKNGEALAFIEAALKRSE